MREFEYTSIQSIHSRKYIFQENESPPLKLVVSYNYFSWGGGVNLSIDISALCTQTYIPVFPRFLTPRKYIWNQLINRLWSRTLLHVSIFSINGRIRACFIDFFLSLLLSFKDCNRNVYECNLFILHVRGLYLYSIRLRGANRSMVVGVMKLKSLLSVLWSYVRKSEIFDARG